MSATSLSIFDQLRAQPDSEAWNRFAELYYPLLRQWTRRMGVAESDANDLVQDVLLVVLRELPRFQHSGQAGAFRAWLRQILRNRLLDFWRARQSRPRATGDTAILERLEQLADEGSGLSQIWNREHDQIVLQRLMESVRARVDPQTWQAFHRQVIGQARADAVAAELSMSLSSVYVAKSRVLAALRQQAAGLIDDF